MEENILGQYGIPEHVWKMNEEVMTFSNLLVHIENNAFQIQDKIVILFFKLCKIDKNKSYLKSFCLLNGL